MKKPNERCLQAVKTLTEFHHDDCASYYSRDGESAVIVINDPELAQRMVIVMGMLLGEEEDAFDEVDGIPVMIPEEPIEA